MNGRTFLRVGALIIVLAVVLSGVGLAQTRYLNSTDGDDSYSGVNPTNNPLGTGPKRTLEGAFAAFASGTTVIMTAGTYNIDQSGIGGGNDADGVTLGTGATKSMTFRIQSYNLNNTVTIAGAGPFVINCGSGTVRFEPEVPGTNTVTLSTATTGLTLTSGTLDVSAMGTGFNVLGSAAPPFVITRAAGAITGTPTYSGSGYTVTYTGTASRTAGGEVPPSLTALFLNQTAGTVTFPTALTFAVTGGGISTTAGGPSHAVFNGLVTLTSATAAVTSTIVNSTGSSWTFAGGITVTSRITPNDGGTGLGVVRNTAGGTIAVTGPVTLTQASITGGSDANHVSFFSNTGAGALRLTGGVSQVATGITGIFTASRTPVINVENLSTGNLTLGGTAATTINGNLTTGAAAGSVTIAGAVTVGGTLTNGAGHIITLGSNTLTVSGAGAHSNAGTISSAGIGVGLLNMSAGSAKSITGTGALPNTQSSGAGLLTIGSGGVGATLIAGNLTSAGSGGITLDNAAAVTVTGALIINAGTLTTNAGGLTTQSGSVYLNAGTLVLGGTLTVFGPFNQNGGTLSFGLGGNLLDLKGNFNRTTGGVTSTDALPNGTPGSGTFRFSGGGPQTFAGGANFTVWNFTVAGVGTGVTFSTGSIIVNRDVVLEANTNVILGSLNIRMVGGLVAGIPASFTHGGQYSATGGGGVIFENPDVAGVGMVAATIGGTGVYSNIEVRLADEYDFVDVAAGTVVTFSGVLTLTRGTIQTTAGTQFNPSTLITVPTIRRNLQDGPLPGAGDDDGFPDGKSIAVAGGAFNATGVSYNLEYFGALNADTPVGSEFITGPTPRVINLTISTTPITFGTDLVGAAEYRFSGNLTVNAGGLLGMPAGFTSELVSTGSNVTHAIVGRVARGPGGTGAFRINGTGVNITGPPSTAAAPAGRLTTTIVSAGADVTVGGGFRQFTDGLVNNGTVNLGLAVVTGDGTSGTIDEGTIGTGVAYTQASTLNLTANVTISGPVLHSDGDINLGAFNMTVTGPSYTRAAVPTAVYTAAPTTTTNGFLVLSSTGMTFDFNGGSVPRLRLAASTTFLSDAEVTDRYRHTAGTVTLGANNLTISGSVWSQEVTGAVYAATTGFVRVTGSATTLSVGSAGVTVPNVEVATTSATFNIVNTGAGAWTTLSISTTLVHTSGTINLNQNDIQFTGTGQVYNYIAGNVVGTTSNVLNDIIGEFKFSGFSGAQTLNLTNSGLTIPNVRFHAGAAVTITPAPGATTMTITNRLTFGGGGPSLTGTGRVNIGSGAWIVLKDVGAVLDAAPVFLGTVNVAYIYGTFGTGPELPTGATTLNNLYINPDMDFPEGGDPFLGSVGNTITLTAAATTTPVVVNGTLTLASGFLAHGATRPVQVANGATVRVENHFLTGTRGVLGGAALVPLGTYNLEYWSDAGDGGYASSGQEWIQGQVSNLSVRMGVPIFGPAATGDVLFLHANRTVGTFVLNCGTGAAGLDLTDITASFGSTLSVTGTTTLTMGTIYNTGGFAAGILDVQGNVSMAAGAAFALTANLQFSGTANQTFTLPAVGAAVANMILNKTGTNPWPTVTLAGGNLTITGTVFFMNGLFVTGTNTLILPPATLGFNRAGVIGTNISHVVGNVRKNLPAFFVGRAEYPVGTGGASPRYRPVAITFLLTDPLITAAGITFNHVDSPPLGTVGFPIDAGNFIQLTGTAPFYWLGVSTVGLGPSQTFDLELRGEGYTTYTSGSFGISQLRIVRRFDGSELTNRWVLQGGANYSNFIDNVPVAGTPIVRVIGSQGGIEPQASRFTIGRGFITDVAVEKEGIPTEYKLAQNFPNPFNPTTEIRFDLPKQSPVTLEIYDNLGQKVKTLIHGELMEPGYYKVSWNGTNESGASVASGVYYYRIVAEKFTQLKKMMFLK